jgi:hypothetical protein
MSDVAQKDDVVGYMFRKMCKTVSDINEHMLSLMTLTKHCETVVEMGVREVVSTWAFIEGLRGNGSSTKTLISVDKNDIPDKEFVEHQARLVGVDFTFVQHDSVSVSLPDTDILFIDTWHSYAHLIRELEAHHEKVKKFIIMHDTESYKTESDSVVFKEDLDALSKETGYPIEEIKKGLGAAVMDFLQNHQEWVIGVHFSNNNGLTVLERKGLRENLLQS